MADIKMKQLESDLEKIAFGVLGDGDYNDEMAKQWAKTAQKQAFELLQKTYDGYKFVVLAEVFGSGGGMVKSLMQLVSADDCVLHASSKNKSGASCYILVVATKF